MIDHPQDSPTDDSAIRFQKVHIRLQFSATSQVAVQYQVSIFQQCIIEQIVRLRPFVHMDILPSKDRSKVLIRCADREIVLLLPNPPVLFGWHPFPPQIEGHFLTTLCFLLYLEGEGTKLNSLIETALQRIRGAGIFRSL